MTGTPETNAALVPRFVLQPLVENALQHRIGSRPSRERTSVVEFLVIWRRAPGGGLRIAVDYYRY